MEATEGNRYKVLQSIAHNIGHSFTSPMNYGGTDFVLGHILRAALKTGLSTLRVDLMSGIAEPSPLMNQEVKASVREYFTRFHGDLERMEVKTTQLHRAEMTLTYDLTKSRPKFLNSDSTECPFVCRVEIVDNRSKTWSAEFSDWWFIEPRRKSWWQFWKRSL